MAATVSLTQPVAVRQTQLRKDETPISTIEDSPQTAARFFKSQFHQKRQSHFGQSPPCGSQAFDSGLIFGMGAEPSLSFRFPRSSRLKLGRDFIRAKTKGQRRSSRFQQLHLAQRAQKVMLHLGERFFHNRISRDQNQVDWLRNLVLMQTERFPQQPTRPASCDRVANFPTRDDPQPG